MSTAVSPVRKKLPIGIQSFVKLRDGDAHYYVDKTGYAVELAQTGNCYFLSRPRRFGKSLFLDTLKQMFEGNRALFNGLWADKRWDWTRTHPVIRISFGGGVLKSRADLDERLGELLEDNQDRLGVACTHSSLAGRLAQLIALAHAQTGQTAVVLIDEYDKPILDNITDSATALDMREGLKDFYSVLKDADEHLRFVFITGVSKFSKVSLFSGLNHMNDITLDARYSAICGYTDTDVDTVFAPELPGLDREEVRRWYNGYNWLGEGVYNPFDLLLLFDRREFKPYWFETGTPTFLINLLANAKTFTPDIGHMVAADTLLSTFDVDHIPPEALMFQAGYLTIDSVWRIPGRMEITLKYPNLEVQASLNDSLLQYLVGNASLPGPYIGRLYRLLQAQDFVGMRAMFQAFFSSIPHDWYRNSPIAQYEGYWASIFYSHFAALGLDIRLEDTTNKGRIDMAVLFQAQVFMFEFKVVELVPEGRALQQIKDKRYADKYRARGEPIHLIGMEFSQAERNVVGFEVETLK
ncbi:MAG: ATP-binding protein [Burkholderiaceae bacterium]|nr:ATP-binding protein [Burkholderiaceae bacterium]